MIDNSTEATMLRTDNIRSLTDFRNNAAAHLKRLAESGGVEVLTVKGKAQGVVMSPRVFDELAEKAHQAEITAKIKRGMAEIAAGEGIEASEAMRQIAERTGVMIPE